MSQQLGLQSKFVSTTRFLYEICSVFVSTPCAVGKFVWFLFKICLNRLCFCFGFVWFLVGFFQRLIFRMKFVWFLPGKPADMCLGNPQLVYLRKRCVYKNHGFCRVWRHRVSQHCVWSGWPADFGPPAYKNAPLSATPSPTFLPAQPS